MVHTQQTNVNTADISATIPYKPSSTVRSSVVQLDTRRSPSLGLGWTQRGFDGFCGGFALHIVVSSTSTTYLLCFLATDLVEKARGLENDVLLVPAFKDTGNVKADRERTRRATRKRPDNKDSWVKGFLSGGTSDKPKDRLLRGRHVVTVRCTCLRLNVAG